MKECKTNKRTDKADSDSLAAYLIIGADYDKN